MRSRTPGTLHQRQQRLSAAQTQIAECCGQVVPHGMQGAVVVVGKFHRVVGIGSRKLTDLKAAGPILGLETKVVLWYMCHCADYMRDQQNLS